jgi:hypothetical protein
MKRSQLGIAGSIALCLVTSQALAVKITSTSSQSGRVEGQGVTVTAAVDWEEPAGPVIISPLVRTTRVVTAAVPTGGIAASPAPTGSINLTLDGTTGLYTGVFPDLPFNSYSMRVTATKTVRNLVPATISDPPPPPVITTATATGGVQVGPPAGCFNFLPQSVDGFTANGFFNFNTAQIAAQASFNPQWSPTGFGGTGAFFLNLAGAQIPTSTQVNGFYRFDTISPSLTGNSNWQGLSGVSFRVFETGSGGLRFHAVVRVRHANGTSGVFTQADPNNPLQVVASIDLPNTFNTVVERFQVAADDQVLGVDIRGYGQPGAAPPNVLIDGVCPRH